MDTITPNQANVGTSVWMVGDADEILVGRIVNLDDDDMDRVVCRWHTGKVTDAEIDCLHPAVTLTDADGATYLRV
jgi:hypothetical protein